MAFDSLENNLFMEMIDFSDDYTANCEVQCLNCHLLCQFPNLSLALFQKVQPVIEFTVFLKI